MADRSAAHDNVPQPDTRGGGATIDLLPRPSLRALQLLLLLHAIPAAALPLLSIDGWPALAVAAAIAASWFYVRRRPALGFGANALVRLVWLADGHWKLERGSGRTCSGVLRGDSLVSSFLLILRFDLDEGGRATRIIMDGDLEPEQMRRLRARLLQTRPERQSR